jgi:hypothetical protein
MTDDTLDVGHRVQYRHRRYTTDNRMVYDIGTEGSGFWRGRIVDNTGGCNPVLQVLWDGEETPSWICPLDVRHILSTN